jgi:hypothetical protein
MAKKRSNKPKKEIILPIDHDYDEHEDSCECDECLDEEVGEIPEPAFDHIIKDFCFRAMLFMGAVNIPGDEESPPPDLNMAKYNIELLKILRAKTDKNLSQEEKTFFDEVLTELNEIYNEMDGLPRIEPIS